MSYSDLLVQPPFTLSKEQALVETNHLIRKRYLWVYETCADGKHPEITCIVAVTRTSKRVAGITKVYTSTNWRRRGCAESLVSHVTLQYVISG